MTPLAGRFYRILFADDLPCLLAGAISPEGRFHHTGQPAFYMSPSPQAAAIAIATYRRDADPPRLVARLDVTGARVADLRRPEVLTALGLGGAEPSVEWQPQRAAGLPATSWIASDAVRASGADGMIYTSRKDPSRWHLVLFHWNVPGRARVTAAGPALEFHP